MIRYAITDPRYYTSSANTFIRRLCSLLDRGGVDWILLRDKTNPAYDQLAQAFLALAPRYPDVRFVLHGKLSLAIDMGSKSLHLPSSAMASIRDAKAAALFTIVSTHTLQEARKAMDLGADAITFSPIFPTPNKGPAQGLEKLKEIKDKIPITLIALGGIVDETQIQAVRSVGADGFASIRYFTKGIL